jgi:hypothetical protein
MASCITALFCFYVPPCPALLAKEQDNKQTSKAGK